MREQEFLVLEGIPVRSSFLKASFDVRPPARLKGW
jgi:hypothetical protein